MKRIKIHSFFFLLQLHTNIEHRLLVIWDTEKENERSLKRRCSNNCSNAIYLFHFQNGIFSLLPTQSPYNTLWIFEIPKRVKCAHSFFDDDWIYFQPNTLSSSTFHPSISSIHLYTHHTQWQWNENRLGRILPSQHKSDNSQSISMNFHS